MPGFHFFNGPLTLPTKMQTGEALSRALSQAGTISVLEQRDKGCPWTTAPLGVVLLSLLAAGRHPCWCWGGKLGQEEVRAWTGALLWSG